MNHRLRIQRFRPRARGPFKLKTALLFLFWGIVLGIIIPGLLLTLAYILYAPELPDPRVLEEYRPPIVSRVYSADGELLAEFAGEKRIWVSLDDVSPCFIKALLSTEDRNFYHHWGIDLKRIFGALIANIRAGRIIQGGSTITQQLARDLFLTRQKILTRKIKEALTAIRLEHRYTKYEILELYINQSYMGKGCYGVQAAAQTFFGKDASELGPAEAAFLVGLLRAPSYYLRDPRRAVRRRNLVLKLMAKSDVMKDVCPIDNLDSLLALPFVMPKKVRGESWKAPYFVDFVRRKVAAKFGEDVLYSGGITIYTTLNYKLQKVAEDTLRGRLRMLQRRVEVLHHPDDPEYTMMVYDSTTGDSVRVWKQINGAVFAVQNGTGRILVMVGGKDFKQSQFNRVTQAIRQPGSAFKPFVYTAAIDNGMQPCDWIDDVPGVWPKADGGEWRPENYDRKYLGKITLREALAHSRNLASVRLCEMVGPKTVVQYAHRMGITTFLDPVLSITMGSSGVKLWDIVTAFSVFPNQGVKITPVAIDRIVDRDGAIIYREQPEKKEVLSKGTAYVMVSMLQSVIDFGTGHAARLFGFLHPAGGKTGTTNDYTDAWFIGFTKDMTAGVRVGFDDMTSIGEGITGSRGALPIWTKLMIAAHPTSPTEKDSFDIPYGEVVFLDICRVSHKLATKRCPVLHEVFLRKNPVPHEYCDLTHTPEDTLREKMFYQPPTESIPPANIDQVGPKRKKRKGL
ncbi:PBP1A family penicillin-binding protein [bacterium]|nr:PBP1A family penicillin-binding protein [bacterium]